MRTGKEVKAPPQAPKRSKLDNELYNLFCYDLLQCRYCKEPIYIVPGPGIRVYWRKIKYSYIKHLRQCEGLGALYMHAEYGTPIPQNISAQIEAHERLEQSTAPKQNSLGPPPL